MSIFKHAPIVKELFECYKLERNVPAARNLIRVCWKFGGPAWHVSQSVVSLFKEIEDANLQRVQYRSSDIRFIKNPSEAVQMMAVNSHWKNIGYIKCPHPRVQMAAVKQCHGRRNFWKDTPLNWINNPSHEVQLECVKLTKGYVLRYLKGNPPEEILLAAVRLNGRVIKYINKPSVEMQRIAVVSRGVALKYIKNPSVEMQMIAVQSWRHALKYIKNPSEAVQLAAIKHRPFAMRYIQNPSEAFQLAAVRLNYNAIQYIQNPSEAVQLASEACQLAAASSERIFWEKCFKSI